MSGEFLLDSDFLGVFEEMRGERGGEGVGERTYDSSGLARPWSCAWQGSSERPPRALRTGSDLGRTYPASVVMSSAAVKRQMPTGLMSSS